MDENGNGSCWEECYYDEYNSSDFHENFWNDGSSSSNGCSTYDNGSNCWGDDCDDEGWCSYWSSWNHCSEEDGCSWGDNNGNDDGYWEWSECRDVDGVQECEGDSADNYDYGPEYSPEEVEEMVSMVAGAIADCMMGSVQDVNDADDFEFALTSALYDCGEMVYDSMNGESSGEESDHEGEGY